ncbi:hypothetical protein M378DRAFT_952109 [Amanita muscaria Koide BX008]|uniref:Uncharacterized protein n=1 Tax=Amanita muscaria (strain Koide BX008) TaxID=946122 RepID=A0A0C2WFE0_AMAMK|nr:hypothetical protein M378DRAFT_952109 [Amanita muscaria Koide BX008]
MYLVCRNNDRHALKSGKRPLYSCTSSTFLRKVGRGLFSLADIQSAQHGKINSEHKIDECGPFFPGPNKHLSYFRSMQVGTYHNHITTQPTARLLLSHQVHGKEQTPNVS